MNLVLPRKLHTRASVDLECPLHTQTPRPQCTHILPAHLASRLSYFQRDVKQSLSEPPGIDFGEDPRGPPQFRALRNYTLCTGLPITGNGFMTPVVTTPRCPTANYTSARGMIQGLHSYRSGSLSRRFLSLFCLSLVTRDGTNFLTNTTYVRHVG